MNALNEVTAYLGTNADRLASEIVDGVLHKLSLEISANERERAINMYADLLGFFGESITAEPGEEEIPAALVEWSKKNAEIQVNSGGSLSEIIVRYSPTREVMSDILTEINVKSGLSTRENSFIIKRINSLLDVSLNATVNAFECLSVQYRNKTEKEIAKLSAPIVPVRNNVVILPLIGEINMERADHIMEEVIPDIVNMETDYVIADFSGVLALNLEIAASLHQIGNMLRLMGIDVLTTGLRPDLVQSIVSGGIDMSASKIYANVKQALETIE